MQRILFHLGPIHVNTFGLMIALGFLAALWVARREATRKGIGEERVTDFAIYALLAGIVGARLGYVFFYAPQYYLRNPLEILFIHQGGMSIHGAVIGGVLVGIWYVRKHKLSFWKLADTLAPSLVLGEAIGRIGCDIFGKPMATAFPWGVTVNGQLLHPAQVYEFLLDYLVFFLLWRKRQHIKYDGQLFLTYVILYAGVRGIVEFFRTNPVVYGPVSIAHVLSLAFIMIGLIAMVLIRQRGQISSGATAYGSLAVRENLWVQVLVLAGLIAASLGLYYGFPI
ncbi:hypothetical protein SY88_09375 [Clostridiales bacterium PH28_bin88]|nr:hypothetical protein SY88_09375 [Clostridiales bacterium PH28_bin88]